MMFLVTGYFNADKMNEKTDLEIDQIMATCEPHLQELYASEQVLWAYNREHLEYMKRYIEATIRTCEGANRSIESRLPEWMKRKQNRDEVSRAIVKLEHTL